MSANRLAPNHLLNRVAFLGWLLVATITCSACSPEQAAVEPQRPSADTTAPQVTQPETLSETPPETSGEPDAIATTFLGQDGRERVVPTGPPPTDADGRLELTFDDLSFEMEKGSKFERTLLTDRINALDGADVRLRGFIRPTFRHSNIEKFVFVRDNQECCFGPGAAIYDNALVTLRPGTQTEYTTRPIVVTGKMSLKEYKMPDGLVLSIYRIKNGRVE